MITLVDLDLEDTAQVDRLARMTFEAFQEHAPDWVPTIDLALNKVKATGKPGRFGRVILQQGQACGWIGVIKGQHIWEIHPIAVAIERQNKGLGRLLVEDVARIAKDAGALTLFAGTSDETGTTNIFNVDLYASPVQAINDLEATGRNPFEFWLSVGFAIVGVMPDAEGLGKPGIHLARRV